LTQFLIVKNLRLQKKALSLSVAKNQSGKNLFRGSSLFFAISMPLRSYWTLASACKYANLHKYNSTLTRCSTQPFRRKKYQQRNKLAPQIIASTAHCGSKICGCAVKSATCREARKQLKLINRPATKVCLANIKKGDAVRRELNIYCLGTICSPLLKRFHSISLQCGIRPQKCL